MLAYSTTVYSLLKYAHVLAAILWIGGSFMVQVLVARLQGANDTARLAAFAKDIEWVGSRVITSLSIVVLVFAIALVVYAPQWSFSDKWIVIGIVGYIVTAVTGAVFLGPEAGRLSKLIDTRSPDDPEVAERIRRVTTVARVDLLVLFFIVADMVFKPGA